MSGTDDKVGGFVFRRSLSASQEDAAEDRTSSAFQPMSWSPQEVGALQRHLRELRGWSQERLCKVLLKRYDPGWDRIKALLTLEAMELAEETSLWAVGLFYGTLFDIPPEALDEFWAALANVAIPPDEETTPYDQLPSHELKELVEWVTLDSLEPENTRALLQLLMDRAEVYQAEQPAVEAAIDSKTTPAEPVSMASTQQIKPDQDGGPGFLLQTSRAAIVPEDEAEDPEPQPEPSAATAPSSTADAQATDLDAKDEEDPDERPDIPLARPQLEGVVLNGADLSGVVLKCANLRGAQLQGVNFKGADLEGADLEGADLAGANLRGANLQYANFQDADLRSAIMREARLHGANLKNAKI